MYEAKIDSQRRIHLVESCLRLLEEAVNYALAEFSLVLIVVHLQNLFKSQRVNRVAAVRETWGGVGLWE